MPFVPFVPAHFECVPFVPFVPAHFGFVPFVPFVPFVSFVPSRERYFVERGIIDSYAIDTNRRFG